MKHTDVWYSCSECNVRLDDPWRSHIVRPEGFPWWVKIFLEESVEAPHFCRSCAAKILRAALKRLERP